MKKPVSKPPRWLNSDRGTSSAAPLTYPSRRGSRGRKRAHRIKNSPATLRRRPYVISRRPDGPVIRAPVTPDGSRSLKGQAQISASGLRNRRWSATELRARELQPAAKPQLAAHSSLRIEIPAALAAETAAGIEAPAP